MRSWSLLVLLALVFAAVDASVYANAYAKIATKYVSHMDNIAKTKLHSVPKAIKEVRDAVISEHVSPVLEAAKQLRNTDRREAHAQTCMEKLLDMTNSSQQDLVEVYCDGDCYDVFAEMGGTLNMTSQEVYCAKTSDGKYCQAAMQAAAMEMMDEEDMEADMSFGGAALMDVGLPARCS